MRGTAAKATRTFRLRHVGVDNLSDGCTLDRLIYPQIYRYKLTIAPLIREAHAGDLPLHRTNECEDMYNQSGVGQHTYKWHNWGLLSLGGFYNFCVVDAGLWLQDNGNYCRWNFDLRPMIVESSGRR